MAGKQQEESVLSQVAFWIGDWAVLMAFWVALTGTFRWTTLLIGAGASLIGSILSVATASMSVARFLPHWRYLWESRSVVWQIPLSVFPVLGAVIQHARNTRGQVRSVPFDPGGEDPESQARRAIAETFPTMSPSSIVVGVDRGRHAVVLHLLGTNSPPPSLERLGEAE